MNKTENYKLRNLIQLTETLRWIPSSETESTIVLLSDEVLEELKMTGMVEETNEFQGEVSKNIVIHIHLFDYYHVWATQLETNKALPVYALIGFDDRTQRVRKFSQSGGSRLLNFELK